MATKIRVLCLIGQLGHGGSEKQLYLYLKHLDRDRYDPIVVANSGVSQEVWRPEIEALGISVHVLGGRTALRPIVYRALLHRTKPDLVFSWSATTNPLVALTGQRRFIGSIRGGMDEFQQQTSKARARLALLPRTIVVNSGSVVRELADWGVKRGRIEVVHNILDRGSQLEADERGALREEIGIPRDKIVVSGAGRDSPFKGFPFWLDVFERAHADDPRLHALLIGRGPERILGHAEIRRRGLDESVTLTGEVIGARRLLGASDVHFLSSSAEGLPNILLEAMDAGCAVLTTDTGGIDDVTEGWPTEVIDRTLVRQRDVGVAAAQLLALAREPAARSKIAEQQAKSLGRFEPQTIRRRYEEVLEARVPAFRRAG